MSVFLILLIAGCSVLGEADRPPTATPERPLVREAVYISDSTQLLTVSLSEVLLSEANTDTQVLAVLANGNGNPSYMMYPSNQPGVPESNIPLDDYPLHIDLEADTASLWVLALHHHAYPISEKVGQSVIIQQLADRFDQLVLNGTTSSQPLSQMVAASPNLVEWFGEIEVLGEVVLPLRADRNWSAGENETQAQENGFRLRYTVSLESEPLEVPTEVAEVQLTPSTPSPEVSEDGAQSIFDIDIPGYRRVVNEDFSEARSTVEWFIGSDPTYVASLVNGAYQIYLTQLEERRDNTALSWGSIQDLVFDTYIIRARVRVLQDDVVARYGLWLHYQNDFNFLFFGMENTGRYRVARFQTGYTELVPWASDTIVNTGSRSNEMEVRVQGNEYTFSINGKPLVTTSDSVFKEGRIAFFCYSESVPATCHLERIEIWMPENAPFPKPTDTPDPD